MRSRTLDVLVVASLVAAVVLAGGYVARIGVQLQHFGPGPAVEFRDAGIRIEEGRLVFTPEWGRVTVDPRAPGWTPGWHASWGIRSRGHVRPMRSIWEFDAHPLGFGYIFAAPIWCFEVVCMIAPLLWVRSRRRTAVAAARGFTVDPSLPADGAPISSPIADRLRTAVR